MAEVLSDSKGLIRHRGPFSSFKIEMLATPINRLFIS